MLSLHPHIYAVKIFLHNTYLASREQRIKNEHTTRKLQDFRQAERYRHMLHNSLAMCVCTDIFEPVSGARKRGCISLRLYCLRYFYKQSKSIYLIRPPSQQVEASCLFLWYFKLASPDLFDEIVWVLVVDGAANRVSSSQKLTADTAQILSHGSVFHDPGSTEHIVPGDVTVVRDVLDLLSVTWWLLEGLDEECRGTRHDGHGSLSILNGQLHGHLEALVLFGVLADVITNFFR